MVNYLELLRSVRAINNENDFIQEKNTIPVCPRLIELYATWLYKVGYKPFDVQNGSVEFRKMMYNSFLSQLTPAERQLQIYDEIQNAELL